MMLAYRLPEQSGENLDELPEILRPLEKLELRVPRTFYVNALAAYPEYRGLGLGTRLLEAAPALTSEAGCDELSLKVFDQNEGRSGCTKATDTQPSPASWSCRTRSIRMTANQCPREER